MNYIYHAIPKDLKGDILYPLNRLKSVFPDIYQKKVKKYEGREYLLTQTIPQLDCLWNDVLHFTAVHPQRIQQALTDVGVIRHFDFFEIKAECLDPNKTIVCLCQHVNQAEKFSPQNVRSYVPGEVASYSELSEETKWYYKETINKGERPLLFRRTPHILYHGTLQLKSINKIHI